MGKLFVQSKLLKDKGFETYFIFSNKLDRLMKIILLEKNPRLKLKENKDILKGKALSLAYEASFKKLPEGFLSEK